MLDSASDMPTAGVWENGKLAKGGSLGLSGCRQGGDERRLNGRRVKEQARPGLCSLPPLVNQTTFLQHGQPNGLGAGSEFDGGKAGVAFWSVSAAIVNAIGGELWKDTRIGVDKVGD